MKAPIRIGILGAAKIAPNAVIAPVRENPEFIVTSVGARDPARARTYAAEHKISGVANGYADLVTRDDVDLVYVALPASMHAEWSIKALEAGKAVLCEKPFCMTAQEATTMVQAAERTRSTLIEAFHYRHHAVLKRALEVARSGQLGKLKLAEAVFEVPIPYREGELRWIAPLGGGALMDLGCYCAHALRTISGEEPKVESASCTMDRGVDTGTVADLTFPSGLKAKLSCSMTATTPAARLFFQGERGALEILNFVAPQIGCRFTVTIDGTEEIIPASGPSTFAAQLSHVGDVLLRGARPLAGGQDAIANMKLIDGIYAAASVARPS